MIMSFRVSELQVLLGFAGKSKSGRKQELLQRALGLVSRVCSIPVQIKIRELYRYVVIFIFVKHYYVLASLIFVVNLLYFILKFTPIFF